MKDHVGNVRTVVNITPGQSAPQVVERNDYLPFGTRMNAGTAVLATNRFRLGGKESQTFGSLDLGKVDFGARMYDPFVAGWTTADPMAAKYGSMSPYSYCGGNPVGIFDNGGLDLVIAGKNGSSVTFKTDLIDKTFSVASLGIDWKGNYSLEGNDLLSAGLDLVGIVDPTGIADLANASLQFKNKDYVGGTLSVVGLVPLWGDLAKAGRVGKDFRSIGDAIGLNFKGTLHRPYIRKWVREFVERRTPRDKNGRFIDGQYDLGHTSGNEFWRWKAEAEAEGMPQKEFNDLMNDPSLYQIEDMHSNRSRKYEKKN